MKGAIVTHPDYLKHDTGGHVENARRLEAILSELDKAPFEEDIARIEPRMAKEEELQRIHPVDYIEMLDRVCDRGGGWLDGDTYASSLSSRVARLAAGGAMRGVEAVMGGEFSWVFTLCRPPGHHATPNRAMGFCLLNNIAIAARHAQRAFGVNRVLIFDWDVHHGNGTQDAFYDDPTVFYSSVHQSPLYPGTGRIQEKGRAKGEGYNLNIPLPPGCGDEEYLFALEEILPPVFKRFQPEILLLSCGFDAHREDPLANMELSTDGFGKIAGLLKGLACDSPAKGRMVAVLEGGYNLRTLAQSVVKVMEAWNSLEDKPMPHSDLRPNAAARRIVEEIRRVHDL